MKILLTGNRGNIGRVMERRLKDGGHIVSGYDLADGKDLLDFATLAESFREIEGIEAVIHLAVSYNTAGNGASNEISANLQALWNLLTLSAKKGVGRFLFMSSVDALGIFKGQAAPKYFPIDIEHPCYPSTEYGISKMLSEELCKCWSEANRKPTVSLRPPGVWFEDTYGQILAAREANPEYEWKPFWEYGAFIDARDLSELCVKTIEAEAVPGYRSFLAAAEDITSSGQTSLELARRIHPKVPVKNLKAYEREPYRSLLDIEPAKKAFGWAPRHNWRDRPL